MPSRGQSAQYPQAEDCDLRRTVLVPHDPRSFECEGAHRAPYRGRKSGGNSRSGGRSMKSLIFASAAFAGAVLATSAFAQAGGTCLQPSQITAASVMDDQTLIVNDRARRTFVVRLNSTCQGPNRTPWRLAFQVPMSQECVRPGDRLTFRHKSV